MSDGRTNTKKRAVSARAVSARIDNTNTMNKRNAKSTAKSTRNAKAAKAKAAPAPAAPAVTPATLAAAIAADPALLSSIASMLGIAPAAPAPAPAPAPAAPAVAKAKAPAVPAELTALVGKTIVIRYEAASHPGRPLVYTVKVDTAWAAKGTFFVKGPVAERDGAERWFDTTRVREWISRG
jgi:hypothetical protein